MCPVVSLSVVVHEMDVMSEEHTAYINRKTGELITLPDENLRLVETDAQPDDLPDWQRDMLPKVREVLESEDFIELPSKHDIHERSIMEHFCDELADEDQRDELLDAIRGRSAFRRFKDGLHRFGLKDEWYRFREEAFEEIAADFLEVNGIEFRRD